MASNLITDVEGVRVGSADDARLASGVTVVLFDEPAIASIAMNGGAPALRDTALLEPEMTIERVDGFVLSGGSAFGLDAAGGVMAYLAEIGRGFEHRGARVPIVPGASLFDLLNGGEKVWGRKPPYWDLGFKAASAAALDFALGTAGAGLWRDDLQSQGRSGLGQRGDFERLSRRRARGRQFGRSGDARRKPAFLGRALRARGGIRRPRLRARRHRRSPDASPQVRHAVQHRPRGRRHRRRVDHDAAQARRDHGPGRLCAGASPRPCADGQRRRLRRRDGAGERAFPTFAT